MIEAAADETVPAVEKTVAEAATVETLPTVESAEPIAVEDPSTLATVAEEAAETAAEETVPTVEEDVEVKEVVEAAADTNSEIEPLDLVGFVPTDSLVE
ncbi:MAG: hypothetical protein P8P83_00200 [Rickettsiaceae bacterium]|nr:hypothetical protein [Rickettsiaceae bacterium]